MAPAGSMNAPGGRAREKIDWLLEDAGWTVQGRDDLNLSVAATATTNRSTRGRKTPFREEDSG
jgi:hypothetical protein